MRTFLLILAAAMTFVVVATGCSPTGGETTERAPAAINEAEADGPSASAAGDGPSPAPAGASEGVGENGAGETQDLTAEEVAARIVELDTALDVPEFRQGPSPVTVSIPSIGVDSSPIDGVGVEDNGELEVPSARRVGWYEYGSAPGQAGSSVLAAHIASGGVNGAFRYLSEAKVGDQVDVAFDDGSTQSFEIIEMAQYDKDELPFERVFARDGEPVVTLITCGGDFQPSVGSYQDNVVAYAIPVAP